MSEYVSNYDGLENYIKDTTAGLGADTTYFHGRIPNAQQVLDKKSIFVVLLPMLSSGNVNAPQSSVSETYSVNVIFFMQDRPDSGINRNKSKSSDNQREMDILRQTNKFCDMLLRKMSDNDISPDLQRASDLITIGSFTKDFAIKETSAYLTGFGINMNVTIPDKFDYCC